jgi:predicted transcriptional regulator of viral defense system
MRAQTQARRGGVDRAIAQIAARQHGVVTRAQLAALGVGRGAIRHRLTIGRLYLLHRGVYAVGHPKPSQEAIWIAGVFAAGEGAVLSHCSATALWDLPSPSLEYVEVTTPVGRSPGPGILAHESQVPADEVAGTRGSR